MKIIDKLAKVIASNIINQGLLLIASLLVAKIYNPSDFGVFNKYLLIYAISSQLIELGISNNYTMQRIENKSQELYQNILQLRLIGAIIIVFAVNAIGYILNLNDKYHLNYILVLIGYIVNLHDASTFQADKEFYKYSKQVLVPTVARLLIIVAFYYSSFEISPTILPSILYGTLLLSIRIKHIKLIMQFDIAKIKKHYRLIYKNSLKLFFTGIIYLIISKIDQLALIKYADNVQLGVYSLAMMISMGVPLITNSLTTVLIPSFSKNHAIAFIDKWKIHILIFIMVLILLEIIFAHIVTDLIFGEKYEESKYPMILLMACYSWSIIVNPLTLIFYKNADLSIFPKVSMIELTLLGIGLFFSTKTFGAIGVALSVFFSKTIGASILGYFSLKEIYKK